jgi:hypothetical protein
MDRRDFLRLRVEQRRRVAELSCAKLYVRYCDYSGGPERAALQNEKGAALQNASDPKRVALQEDVLPWEGEPPSEVSLPTTEQLFMRLDEDLRAVDVVRVLDADWLGSGEFRRKFELVMSRFRARGGRVEYLKAGSSDAPLESV